MVEGFHANANAFGHACQWTTPQIIGRDLQEPRRIGNAPKTSRAGNNDGADFGGRFSLHRRPLPVTVDKQRPIPGMSR
jgi:hypothetical protein